jgi:diacylglycerol diphosphate phosphatase / phosphatidate phosphatase
MFFINNINLLYPHAEVERVPVFWNIIYAAGVPFATLVICLAVTRASVHKFHVSILGLLIR